MSAAYRSRQGRRREQIVKGLAAPKKARWIEAVGQGERTGQGEAAGQREPASHQGQADGGGPEPVVSVIIPVYNGERFLSQAVDSALAQQVPLEILVINDCSTDNTERVMERYRENPAVRYLVNEKNLGAGGSRNRGVKLAKGTYVAFLDADDWWAEGKLKKQLERLEETGMVLCCTGRELMDENGVSMGRVIPVPEVITYRRLLSHNCINCSSTVLRREAALEFPMEHEDSHEDYIAWLRLLKKYGCACGVNEPLLKYRLSGKGKSGSKLKSAGMTFRVYRYMGFGWGQSLLCFVSYALHGVWKYRRGTGKK